MCLAACTAKRLFSKQNAVGAFETGCLRGSSGIFRKKSQTSTEKLRRLVAFKLLWPTMWQK